MFAAPRKRPDVHAGNDLANNSVSYAMYVPAANRTEAHQPQIYRQQDSFAAPTEMTSAHQRSAVSGLHAAPLPQNHTHGAAGLLQNAHYSAQSNANNALIRPSTPIVGAAPQLPALDALERKSGHNYSHQQSLAASTATQNYLERQPKLMTQTEPVHFGSGVAAVSEAEHPPFPEEQRMSQQTQQTQQVHQIERPYNGAAERPASSIAQQNAALSDDQSSVELRDDPLDTATSADDVAEIEARVDDQDNDVSDNVPLQREMERKSRAKSRRRHKHRHKRKGDSTKPKKSAPWSRQTKNIVFMIVSAIVSMLAVFVLLALTNPTFVQQSVPDDIARDSIQAPLDMRKAAILAGVAGVATLAMPFLWRHCAPHAASFLPWKL